MKDCSGLSSLREGTTDQKRRTVIVRSDTQRTEPLNCQNYFKFALLGGMTPETMMLIYLCPGYGVTGKQLVLFKLFTVSVCVECVFI